MKSITRLRSALCLPLVGLLMVTLAPSGHTAMLAPASLRVSPGSGYVGGQALTFEGNIGKSGRNRISLQFHMNRPGDSWVRVAGFSDRTAGNGDFRFEHPAPSNFGTSFRVVSGRAATPRWTFEAKSQDLTVEVVGGEAVADEPFELRVDTTPTLRRRPDTIGLQPFPGRELTLQARIDGDSWRTLDTTQVKGDGLGFFTVTEADPGTVVYRVRQEDWTVGASDIGWFPSFPLYVDVRDPRDSTQAAPTSALTEQALACSPEPGVPHAAAATASTVNRWAPSLFDFAWFYGESLTSPPYRGTKRKGMWVDYADGGGRVTKQNGGLMLDSKRENDCGAGDFGTTRATLQGNPMTYGRWEVRLRLKSHETNARDYRTLVELVPERESDYACGARNITVADMRPRGSTIKFGANSRSKQWNGSKSTGGSINNQSQVLAVEVTRRHVSWFLSGKVIGTVRNRAVSSDVPMTLRFSMVGAGEQEMNATQLISDWQRGFTLSRGKQVRSGKALKRSSYSPPSC